MLAIRIVVRGREEFAAVLDEHGESRAHGEFGVGGGPRAETLGGDWEFQRLGEGRRVRAERAAHEPTQGGGTVRVLRGRRFGGTRRRRRGSRAKRHGFAFRVGKRLRFGGEFGANIRQLGANLRQIRRRRGELGVAFRERRLERDGSLAKRRDLHLERGGVFRGDGRRLRRGRLRARRATLRRVEFLGERFRLRLERSSLLVERRRRRRRFGLERGDARLEFRLGRLARGLGGGKRVRRLSRRRLHRRERLAFRRQAFEIRLDIRSRRVRFRGGERVSVKRQRRVDAFEKRHAGDDGGRQNLDGDGRDRGDRGGGFGGVSRFRERLLRLGEARFQRRRLLAETLRLRLDQRFGVLELRLEHGDFLPVPVRLVFERRQRRRVDPRKRGGGFFGVGERLFSRGEVRLELRDGGDARRQSRRVRFRVGGDVLVGGGERRLHLPNHLGRTFFERSRLL